MGASRLLYWLTTLLLSDLHTPAAVAWLSWYDGGLGHQGQTGAGAWSFWTWHTPHFTLIPGAHEFPGSMMGAQ